MTWIANGESGSSVRAKLNALMVPISSLTISTPVEYVDIALPSGYERYFVEFGDVRFAGTNGGMLFSGALSTDAGTSFFNDANNVDTYGNQSRQQRIGFSFADSYVLSDDGLFVVAGYFQLTKFDASMDGKIVIAAGSATIPPRVYVISQSLSDDATEGIWRDHVAFLNPTATTPPVLAPINLVRLLPYGNADAGPPTSGDTITAGTFHLFGLPT